MSVPLNVEQKTEDIPNTLDLLSEGEVDDDKDEKVITDTEGGNKEDLLKDEKEVVKDKKDKEDEEELPNLDELDADDEPKPENLDLVVPVRRREILAKYPKIFKDFPYLENAYFRDQQYTELLPTIADAKEVIERSKTLEGYEKQLFSGNTEQILKDVKQQDENAFAQIVDNYLPNLAKVDKDAYHHIIGNIIKHTVANMFGEAKRLGSEDLEGAARLLHQFVFNSTQWNDPQKFAKDVVKNPEEGKLSAERQQFNTERFNSALADVSSRADNALKSTIDIHIDPKGSMSDYVKRNAIRDCLSSIQDSINNDSRFKQVLDKLWEQSAKEGYSRSSQDKIRSTYLSKAKSLLPQLISKARNEALKGSGQRASDDNKPDKDRRGPLPVGRGSSQNDTRTQDRKVSTPQKGMKTIDFFNQD